MNFNAIYQETIRNESLIFAFLNNETEIITNDYLEELYSDFEADQDEDSDESFESYCHYYADEIIDFALVPYVLGIISNICNISSEEINRLSADEKHHLTVRTINHFKKNSGLGTVDEE